MKVYISADMEGATGVVVRPHVDSSHAEYQRMRKLLTGDVNAAIEGAFQAGATEVVVNDAHGNMTNILIEELDGRARLVAGFNKQLLQMEGIDDSFACAFLVAYHSREGADGGILNHTLLGRLVNEVRLNGEPVGETAISAGIAGAFGVPVVLVTGDEAVCREAQSLLGNVEVVPVKTGIDRLSGVSLPPARSRELIRDAAARAVAGRGRVRPFVVSGPVEFQVDFKTSAAVTTATLFPQVRKVSPRTVAISAPTYLEAFRMLWGALLLGLAGSEGSL